MAAARREFGTAARLAAFAGLLAVVGGGAAGIGSLVGNESGATASASGSGSMDMHAEDMSPAAQARANGLATSAGGFTFQPEQTSFAPGSHAFRFRIVDAKGAAAHDFTVEGGVRLHLIVVRRDFAGYRHVHPRLQPDGSWLVRLNFTDPGVYRAFADFEDGGRKTVLGRDLFIAGAMRARPLPAASTVTRVGADTVTLSAPELRAGKEADLRFDVSRNGTPVRAFQSYIGMRGHLVALHDGDLSYSHVHPLDGSKDGRIEFRTQLPTAGAYRVFLQFKVAGSVVTAPFTLRVKP